VKYINYTFDFMPVKSLTNICDTLQPRDVAHPSTSVHRRLCMIATCHDEQEWTVTTRNLTGTHNETPSEGVHPPDRDTQTHDHNSAKP